MEFGFKRTRIKLSGITPGVRPSRVGSQSLGEIRQFNRRFWASFSPDRKKIKTNEIYKVVNRRRCASELDSIDKLSTYTVNKDMYKLRIRFTNVREQVHQ